MDAKIVNPSKRVMERIVVWIDYVSVRKGLIDSFGLGFESMLGKICCFENCNEDNDFSLDRTYL